jgi:hypothetical protein
MPYFSGRSNYRTADENDEQDIDLSDNFCHNRRRYSDPADGTPIDLCSEGKAGMV